MYRERMIGYYPPILRSIKEFQAIANSTSSELEELDVVKADVLSNAYLTTMGEERLKQWEKILNIVPVENSTIEDRRDTVIARIRGQGKLNTALINTIVKTFTGGTADSWIKDGVLYVKITPPQGNKQYKFDNVVQELRLKIPAHLGLDVQRKYLLWGEVDDANHSWKQVRACYKTWGDMLLNEPSEPNELDVTTFENFYLG